MVRGELRRPARRCHITEVFHGSKTRNQTRIVGLHPLFVLMPDRPDAQPFLLYPDVGFQLGLLDIGVPHPLVAPVGDVGPQDICPLGQGRPVVEGRLGVDLQPQAGRRGRWFGTNMEACRGTLVVPRDPSDLAIDPCLARGPSRGPDTIGQPCQRLCDAAREIRVRRLLPAAARRGMPQRCRLAGSGPGCEVDVDAVTELASAGRIGELLFEAVTMRIRRSDDVTPARIVQPCKVRLAGHGAIGDPHASADAVTCLHRGDDMRAGEAVVRSAREALEAQRNAVVRDRERDADLFAIGRMGPVVAAMGKRVGRRGSRNRLVTMTCVSTSLAEATRRAWPRSSMSGGVLPLRRMTATGRIVAVSQTWIGRMRRMSQGASKNDNGRWPCTASAVSSTSSKARAGAVGSVAQ